MAREKKPVHRVQMTEGKRNIIHQLLESLKLSYNMYFQQLYQLLSQQRRELSQVQLW